jgi:heavy metal sensor kinase
MMIPAVSGVRLRLTAWYAGTMGVVLLLFSIIVFFSLRHTLLSQVNQTITEYLSEAMFAIADSDTKGNDELDELSELDPERLCYIEKNGIGIVETPAWQRAGLGKCNLTTMAKRRWQKIDHHNYYIGKMKLSHQQASYLIGVALDVTLVIKHLRLLALILITGVPASLLLVMAGGLILTGRILKPVRSITAMAAEITGSHLDRRLPIANPADEFGRLAAVFNGMLTRLDRSFEELKRFTADASHELRTPLTAIRSVGETALQKDLTAEGYREVIGSILEEVDRQRNLVENLLLLARSDANQIHLKPEMLDLRTEVRECVDLLRILAEEKRQEITFKAGERIMVKVDRNTLRQALINIIDNAIKFTSDSGTITITAALRQKHIAFVEIADQGPGIAAAGLEKIFNRFYRADTSRSSGHGGNGLGLSIAKSAAEAIGGTIEVESELEKGSCFRIVLPVAE